MSNQIISITKGDKYGQRSIIHEVRYKDNPMRYFLCRCSCWEEKVLRMSVLRNWTTKSCGCMKEHYRLAAEHKYILINHRWGKLII